MNARSKEGGDEGTHQGFEKKTEWTGKTKDTCSFLYTLSPIQRLCVTTAALPDVIQERVDELTMTINRDRRGKVDQAYCLWPLLVLLAVLTR